MNANSETPPSGRPWLVYLSKSYYTWRIPLYDELHRRLGARFHVVTLRRQETANDRLAQQMGSFKRTLIRGRHLFLTRRHQEGEETPLGLTIAPTLPFTLLRLRPRVVISDTFTVWTLVAVLMRSRVVIYWEGTTHTERTAGGKRMWLRRWIARRAKAFVVNGALSRQYLTDELGVPAERIFEGGHTPEPPPARFEPRQPRRLAAGEPIRYLFAGRLIKRKGPEHLIHAAAMLRERLDAGERGGTRFEVMFVGDGDERPRLEQLAANLGVSGNVRFVGYVPPSDVWDYYAQAHVFVLPTIQDNWPLVVAEAMSMGLPILLSNLAGSVPDLIDPGRNGDAFQVDDHTALAFPMQRYLDQPELVEQHGRRSLELVAPYAADRIAEVYLRAVSLARSEAH